MADRDRAIIHVGDPVTKPFYCPVNHETGELVPQTDFPKDVGPEDLQFCSQHAGPPIWMLGFELAITSDLIPGSENMSADEFIQGLRRLIETSPNVLRHSVSEYKQVQ